MKVIIAGGRDFYNYKLLEQAVQKSGLFMDIDTIICGEARGADYLGKKYARRNNIPVLSFPADWDKYGKRAGFIRNVEMAEAGDALIAMWDGVSKGTKHMIDTATIYKLEIYIEMYEEE